MSSTKTLNAISNEKVLAKLKDLKLDFTLHRHANVLNVIEQEKELKANVFTNCSSNTTTTTTTSENSQLTKNLFLKDKKKGYFLVTLSTQCSLDTKALGNAITVASNGTGSKMALRFAKEEDLATFLHVQPGAVTPLSVMFDTEAKVTWAVEASLMTNDKTILMHPCSSDQTVAMNATELKKFMTNCEHEPLMLDLENLETVVTLPPPAASKVAKTKKKNDGKKVATEAKSKEGVSVTKSGNFHEWYTETITKSGMIDYYDISGCYILRPWSYAIWETIQQFLDSRFKSLGVKNCYFPMFVSEEKLKKEETHLEGFAPEVAWVTKYGNSDLAEPIAIRPTSETIMYPAFKNWIRSHRDLPLKLNQWNNVVRWEFKNPTPFIRTREFLWQEGHTAHATQAAADAEVRQILNFYTAAYKELLAVPMIQGIKTEKEKFAGADYTTTIEGFIPGTGRGIQAATSHALGQNFGKMFNISAEGLEGEKIIPYQNSWGFTTRSIGVMVMTHGDDKGLVLPPMVAPTQVILIPIPFKDPTINKALFAKCNELFFMIKNNSDMRVDVDDREIYTPGWKYNHWELKGVPLRLELGPRDLENDQVRVVRRDTGEKIDVKIADLLVRLPLLLKQMQEEMYEKAEREMMERIVTVMTWKEFVPALSRNCMVLAPFCNETEWEEKVKEKSKNESLAANGEDGAEEADNTAVSMGAKSLCMPFEQNEKSNAMPEGTVCFISGKPATKWVLWGRSY